MNQMGRSCQGCVTAGRMWGVLMNYSEGDAADEVAPGVVMYLPGEATFTVEVEGQPLTVTMWIAHIDEGVRPTAIRVEAEGVPVTGTMLRAIRVQELAREAIRLGMKRGYAKPGGASVSTDALLTRKVVDQVRSSGPVPESLGWVAYVYNAASVLGDPPARAVEEAFGMPRTTVTKWVRRARDLGLIESSNGEHPEAS